MWNTRGGECVHASYPNRLDSFSLIYFLFQAAWVYTRVIFCGFFPAWAWCSWPWLCPQCGFSHSPWPQGKGEYLVSEISKALHVTARDRQALASQRTAPTPPTGGFVTISKPRPRFSLSKSQVPSSRGTAAPHVLLAPKARHFPSVHTGLSFPVLFP